MKTIQDKDKSKYNTQILMFIHDVYGFWDSKIEYSRRLGEMNFCLEIVSKNDQWIPKLAVTQIQWTIFHIKIQSFSYKIPKGF